MIFGYDVGISGGVTAMDSFLKSFFPDVIRKRQDAKQNQYCVYNNQALTAFTSSLYIAGMFSSLAAGRVTKVIGRQAVMLLGGAAFFIGAAINAAAVNVLMLILGRILLGFGVGFINQATPGYLGEMAPSRWRGALNTGFQFFLGVGVVIASLTNYGTSHLPGWGWRVSLGLAAAPASIMLIGAFIIPDTPSSLIQRGRLDAARTVLHKIRGSSTDIETEFRDIVQSVEISKVSEEGAFRRIVRRRYRPQLVMAVAIPLFQQFSGVTVVAFFSPVLFRTVGFGSNSALMGAVILGAVHLGSILVSTFMVDRCGRKLLFVQGGAQMIICQVGVSWILGAQIGSDSDGASLPRVYSLAVLVLMCAFTAGFGWSWGPLSWLIPSEIFPVEIRSAGQSISVAINLGVTFIQTQTFLAMLCRFEYLTFAFYASWVVVMTVFVAAFLPETRGVPLESINLLWEKHWYWSRFVKEVKKVEPF